MKIVPMGGVFKDCRSLLASIMEDEKIKKVVVVTMDDESYHMSHINMTHEELALCGAVITRSAVDFSEE